MKGFAGQTITFVRAVCALWKRTLPAAIREGAILRAPTAYAASYLLRVTGGWIIVDTDIPGSDAFIMGALDILGAEPGDVRLIALTHGHVDHAGSARDLARLTGAPVAIHPSDMNLVRYAPRAIPPISGPFGRQRRVILGMCAKCLPARPFDPDLELTDGQTLEDFGLPATVVWTPGHTFGSISIVTSRGEAFIGDLASIRGPKLRPNAIAMDPTTLDASLKRLLGFAPRAIYPGHGKAAFPTYDRQRWRLSEH